MRRVNEEEEEQQVWRVLSEAGLVEIRLDEFAERVGDVKRLVMMCLRDLLNETGMRECESAAYSLGTLKGLELKLRASAPQPPDQPQT